MNKVATHIIMLLRDRPLFSLAGRGWAIMWGMNFFSHFKVVTDIFPHDSPRISAVFAVQESFGNCPPPPHPLHPQKNNDLSLILHSMFAI